MKRTFFWMILSLVVWVVPSFAETSQPDRIQGAITNSPTVMLQGNIHPKAQPQYDMGPVESSLKPGYITMVLQPTAAQQADMKQLLKDLQNPSSPNYHQWLAPEQYAARFGVSQHDMTKIVNWLAAQGFEVLQPARGRNWIAFTGTADLIQQTFQTEIHYYMVNGEKHFANSSNPVIPEALAGIVMGFRGMNNFAPKPSIKNKGVENPFYTGSNGNNLGPADIATIYDIQPLLSSGTTGSGQKLVVVGQTDIDTTDISEFRSGFGLSATLPTITLVPGDTDPGTTGDLGEADLDLEWAGAVAQNATLLYIIGNPTTGNGVFDSAQYAIDQNLAPVISMSYGGCEQQNVTFIPFFEPILQQASTEGITFVASSGDSGAAGCDSDQSAQGTLGLAVNYPASSPEVTGVGGTEFNEGTGTYWGSNGTGLGSALSYIPEIAWNDTSINNSLSAAGGGKSSCGVESGGACTGGFPKPTWQKGTGVPADGVRDVPDIAMAASADHDGYIFCSQSSCASGIANAVTSNSIVGGTSASAPVFAGIISLLNDYVVAQGIQSKPGLGNINQKLYSLAQSDPTIYHDVTSGNNIVPCQSGTPNCPSSAPFQYGYSAGVGYDQVTGLGSVDANAFVIAFAGTSTTTTLALSPAPTNGQYVGTTQTVTLMATVTANSGTGTPTGTVTFMDGSTALGTPQTLVSGSASLAGQVLSAGLHSLTAVYSGDSKFPGSTSAVFSALVTTNSPSATNVQLSSSSISAGGSVMITGTVTGGGTTPTGILTFLNGTATLGTGTLSGGTASIQSTFVTGGTYNITASYSGDATYGNSTSSSNTANISPLNVMDFSLTQNATINISAPGGNGSASITATPLGGFSGTIAYTCSGAPSEATCTVTATSTGATVMVTTTAATSQLQRNRNNGLFYAMLLPGMLGMLLVGRKKKSYRAMQMIMLIVVLGMSTLWMAACGGGPSGGSGGNPNPGTPAGMTTLTITGTSGSLTRTAPVILNIL